MRVFSYLLKILLPLAFTNNIAIGIVCFIAESHRQQAGDSPATTARGNPDPSPLTGTDWLSNESSLETDTFTAAPGQPGASGKLPSKKMESTIVNGAWKGHLGRGLARRQVQFLLLVFQGLTSKEIARACGVAPGTVDKSLQRAMTTQDVKCRAALVAKAGRDKIITPLCLLLAGLIAMHAATDSGMARRDRRPSERRSAEMRLARRADAFELAV